MVLSLKNVKLQTFDSIDFTITTERLVVDQVKKLAGGLKKAFLA